MKAIGRGCLEFLIVWAAAAYGLFLFFHERFEPEGDLYGGIAGGFLVASAWGLLRNSFLARKQARLIGRALAGERPNDGEMYAAVGTAKALGHPLKSPFREAECVLYAYEVFQERTVTRGTGKDRRTEKVKSVAVSGYAMSPWAIRSKSGDIRILGFPLPEKLPENRTSGATLLEAVRKYVASTTFLEFDKWDIGKLLKKVTEIFADDDGIVREDMRFKEATYLVEDPAELETCIVSEQFITPNTELTIIGKYTAAKGGLVYDMAAGGLELIPGSGEAGMKALRSRARQYTFFAIVMMLLGTAGAFGILTARERSTEIREKHEGRFIDALGRNDLVAAERALKVGVSANLRDKERAAPVVLRVKSREMLALLKKYGLAINARGSNGETPLLYAMDDGRPDLVEMFLEIGADPNTAQGGWGRTVLETAFDRGDARLFQVLQSRGAKGLFATKDSGTRLSPADEGALNEVLAKYAAGLRERNVEAVRASVDGWPQDFFESVERGLYESSRPEQWRVVEGYQSGEVATALVKGETRRGAPERYLITFIRRDGAWKIRRESWDERQTWRWPE